MCCIDADVSRKIHLMCRDAEAFAGIASLCRSGTDPLVKNDVTTSQQAWAHATPQMYTSNNVCSIRITSQTSEANCYQSFVNESNAEWMFSELSPLNCDCQRNSSSQLEPADRRRVCVCVTGSCLLASMLHRSKWMVCDSMALL